MKLLLLSFLLLSITGLGQIPKLDEGIDLLEKEDPITALEVFEQILEEQPSDSAHYYVALSSYLLEDDAGALKNCGHALNINPQFEPAVLLKSTIYNDRDDFKSAAQTLTGYINAYPENCRVYLARAVLYRHQFEPTEFVSENLQTALYYCDDSTAVSVLLLLGQNYYDLEAYKQARNVYDELLELAPTDPDVQFDVATYYLDVGEYEIATDLLNTYLEKRPKDLDALFQLGYGQLAMDDLSGAVTTFNTYIRKDSLDADGWYNRGLAYAGLKEYRFALRDLSMARELAPDLWEVAYNIGLVHQNKGAYLEALPHYTTYIEHIQDDPEAFYNRGICKYYSADVNGACADWQRMLDLGATGLWKDVKQLCDR